ncbi:hypothetical protein VU04_12365, partial [Desulfobulbus sp. TB]|nr:hypothetical protein [Desulfobulbus sp. TB]
QRAGRFKFFLIYGSKDSNYPPIIRIEKYNSFIIEKLRFEVWKSLQIKKQDNPYSLNALLTKGDSDESAYNSIS